MKSTIITLLGLMIFTGCGANGPQFTGFNQPKSGKGMLYVYRPSNFVGSGNDYSINTLALENTRSFDRFIGNLINGSYLKVEMKPGQTTIWTSVLGKKFSHQVDIKKNKISCIRFDVQHEKLFETIPNGQCLLEMRDTKANL